MTSISNPILWMAWIGLGVYLCGRLAGKHGHSQPLWATLGFCFTFISLIVLAAFPSKAVHVPIVLGTSPVPANQLVTSFPVASDTASAPRQSVENRLAELARLNTEDLVDEANYTESRRRTLNDL